MKEDARTLSAPAIRSNSEKNLSSLVRPLESSPEQLVVDGKVRFGAFDRILKANLIDADAYAPRRSPKWFRHLRLKEFQVFQAWTDEVFVFLGLSNFKVAGQVMFRVYEFETGKHLNVHKNIVPVGLRNPDTLADTDYRWKTSKLDFSIRNRMKDGTMHVDYACASSRHRPSVGCSLTIDYSDCDPMVSSIPFGRNQPMYATKMVGPVDGEFEVGRRSYLCNPATSSMIVDDHKGYYPFRWWWDWITGVGFVDGNRHIAFSFTRNQSIDPERYNENCVWLDRRLHHMPTVYFARDDKADPPTWVIRDRHGMVDLTLTQSARTVLKQEFLVGGGTYQGPEGYFNGRLTIPTGESFEIRDMYGMGEELQMRG